MVADLGGDDQDNEDSSDPGADVMKGGPGNDRLVSEAGRNTLYGNEGDDLILDYAHYELSSLAVSTTESVMFVD